MKYYLSIIFLSGLSFLILHCSSSDDFLLGDNVIEIIDLTPELLSVSDSVYYASDGDIDTLNNCTLIVDIFFSKNGKELVLNDVLVGFVNGCTLNNIIVTGEYKIVVDPNQCIADTTVFFKGKTNVPYWSIRWFGARGDKKYSRGMSSLTDKGFVDDTPYINHAIKQSLHSSVQKIYIPAGDYIIRNQILEVDQERYGQIETTMKCAINLYDNTELFGEGNKSLLIVEDKLFSSELVNGRNWDRSHCTTSAIGLARWDEPEIINAGYTLHNNHAYRYMSRENVKIHGFAIDCRNSYRNLNLTKDLCNGISIFSYRHKNDFMKENGYGENSEIYNMYIYDASAGIRIRNISKNNKIIKNVSIYNNTLELGANKAIEISQADSCHIYGNTIKEYESGLQTIFNANYNTFENNTVLSSNWGIHITHGSSFNTFKNNSINTFWQAVIFKQDYDPDPLATWETKGNVLINNYLHGNLGNSYHIINSSTLLCFAAWPTTETNSNTYKYVDNILKENQLIGRDIYIGASKRFSRAALTINIDGFILEGNTIKCENIILLNDRENMDDRVANVILRNNSIEARTIQSHLGESTITNNIISKANIILSWGKHIIDKNVLKENSIITSNNASYSGENH